METRLGATRMILRPALGPAFSCHRLHVRAGGTVTTTTDPAAES